VILVAQPWRVRQSLAGGVALRTLAPLLILTPLLAFAIWWTVLRTLAPIGRVVGEVQRRDADSLAPLIATDLPREIEPLVAELNRLLERLAVAFQAQRAFISDAAHELRSPLTALRLQLQLLGRAADQPARDEALGKLGEAMDRCGALVQQLLTLARNEPGAVANAFAATVLDVVVREAIADSASLAVARGTDLAFEADPGIGLMADAESLRVLVRNLVDNAVRYAPAGGRVLVRLLDLGASARLIVEDSGPGIAESERKQVFDRFYRGLESGQSGSGLGLAIVKAIAERHHAVVELGRSGLGGLQVTVLFPKTAGGRISRA
jgi:signal transduction histidine kinase